MEILTRYDVPFSELTTVGCGGVARRVLYPDSIEALKAAIARCEEAGEHPLLLGCGSDVLPPDGVYERTVIVTSGCRTLSLERDTVIADCGVSVAELISFCRAHGRGGWEFLVGIPASVGGLTALNAGANEYFMSDIVLCVTGIMAGKVVRFPRDACNFGHKSSRFPKEGIPILSVELALPERDPFVSALFAQRSAARRAHQPKGRSMGCVFRNPVGYSAGALIRACGLCGYRLGGAMIAKSHGNFILNVDGATSEEISALISLMKERVKERFRIDLKEEIVVLQ